MFDSECFCRIWVMHDGKAVASSRNQKLTNGKPVAVVVLFRYGKGQQSQKKFVNKPPPPSREQRLLGGTQKPPQRPAVPGRTAGEAGMAGRAGLAAAARKLPRAADAQEQQGRRSAGPEGEAKRPKPKVVADTPTTTPRKRSRQGFDLILCYPGVMLRGSMVTAAMLANFLSS